MVTIVLAEVGSSHRWIGFNKERTMRISHSQLVIGGIVVAIGLSLAWLGQAKESDTSSKLDAKRIGEAAKATPVMTPDGVVKCSWPRTDVPVQIDGLRIPPFMGLTSWAAFAPGGKEEAMLMGDLVLFQDEVNDAMDAAFEEGLSVTALHNHFFYDEPKVYFMHIAGEGDAADMASGVRGVLDVVHEIRRTAPKTETSFRGHALPDRSTLDAASLAAVLGGKPAEKDGMCKFTIGRTVKMPCGCQVGKEMGVNTWAAFYGSTDNAIVDGDFATFAGELQTVLRTLRAQNINIVAIHSHMEGEAPHVIFLHYWGRGPAVRLAQGVKAALDAQSKVATVTP